MHNSHVLCICNYSSLANGVSDITLQENIVLTLLSLKCDLNLVQKTRCRECLIRLYQRCGIVSSQLYTVCRHLPADYRISPQLALSLL